MDGETRKRAHKKLNAIKAYIAYPKELLDNNKLEEEYQGLEISGEEYFQNSINMSIWSTNKHWRKLREVVNLSSSKQKANQGDVSFFVNRASIPKCI